jgi:predicted small lipoprotein YifL
MKIAVVFVLLCLSLGACGQKGPLYLPQPNKPQPEAPAPQTEPAQPKAEQSQAEPAATNQPATPAE